MTPEQFWVEVRLLQNALREVEMGIGELWQLMQESPHAEHYEIYIVLREKYLKQGRILGQLQYLQDNMSNPNL